MNGMRILFVTQFYWPEVRTAPLNLASLAEDLAGRGHEVTVMTAFPNHPFGRFYDGYRPHLRRWEWLRGVRVLRLPLVPDHSLSAFRRAVNYGSFALSAVSLGSFLLRRLQVDVIFAYLPPLSIGFPAARQGRKKRAPIVFWMTDLWPENLLAAGARIGPRLLKAISRLEDWVYRKASLICVNSPGYIDNLAEKGVKREKIRLLTDWADENLFFPVPYDRGLAEEWNLAGKFTVMYGGNLGKVQGLEVIIEAARLLSDMPDIRFVLVGDGSELARLQAMAADIGLTNLQFIPRQEPADIHRFYGLADVLLVHLEKRAIFKMQIPSKIMAYLACGRPVLCAVEGEAARLIEEAGAGLTCASGDSPALAGQVRRFYSMSPAERRHMGERARQSYLQHYTRKIQLERVEAFLREAVEAKG